VRRQLPHTVTFERGGDRLDPLGTVLAEVVHRQVATEGAHALRDPVAQLAAVQRSRSLLGDEATRARQVGLPEPFAGPRGPRVIRLPDRPLALSPYSLWSFADQTRANRSPPIPVIGGSTTLSTAAAVTAASMALPPRSSTPRPAAVASGWLVAIMPCGAYTVE